MLNRLHGLWMGLCLLAPIDGKTIPKGCEGMAKPAQTQWCR